MRPRRAHMKKAAFKITFEGGLSSFTPRYLVSVLFNQFLRYCFFSCIYCNEI
jgi:hypothetical protein